MANNNLTQERVVVMVFAMPDCPACEEYVPRFLKVSEPYRRAGVPIYLYDVASEDPNLQALCDRYKIHATPTTLVLPRGPGQLKLEGAADDTTIDQLMRRAYGVHLGTGSINAF